MNYHSEKRSTSSFQFQKKFLLFASVFASLSAFAQIVVSPLSASPGQWIVIKDANFSGLSSIKFNGMSAAKWVVDSTTYLRVEVPSGNSGPISLAVSSGTLTTPSFTIIGSSTPAPVAGAPTISSMPANAARGSEIRIQGTNITSNIQVYFKNSSGQDVQDYFQWNSTSQVTAKVPPTAVSGNVRIANSNGSATRSIIIDGTSTTNPPSTTEPPPTTTPVAGAPTISSMPTSAARGTEIRIEGTNITPDIKVYFKNSSGQDVQDYFLWNSNTRVTAKVPPTAVSGAVRITNSAGSATRSINIDGTTAAPPTTTEPPPTSGAPTISSMPSNATRGSEIRIQGSNITSNIQVYFKNSSGQDVQDYFQWNSTSQVTAKVPPTAVSGNVRIANSIGSATRSITIDGTTTNPPPTTEPPVTNPPPPTSSGPSVTFPKSSLAANELAVIVNDADPQSVTVADYYRQKRGIPSENIFHINIPKVNGYAPNKISASDFNSYKASVDNQINSRGLNSRIQAQVITWKQPYKVICPNGVDDSVMSITSAFTFGYHSNYCKTAQCSPTPSSPYYDSDSVAPFANYNMRPTMALLGDSVDAVKRVIDRGVASDGTNPSGTSYMIRTPDSLRSVRWPDFQSVSTNWNVSGTNVDARYYDYSNTSMDYITNKSDVMFYFTGDQYVEGLSTNVFRPGAIADHMTSHGGNFEFTSQMHVTDWLNAGAVASYGNTTEPCNYTEKFPVASKVMHYYYRGATAIEAYWKSVKWPGEGLFVGDPLAKPFAVNSSTLLNGTLTLWTTQLKPGRTYRVEASDSPSSGYSTVLTGISVPDARMKVITILNANKSYYRLLMN